MRRSLVALALALVLPLPVWAGQVTVKEGETLSEIADRYGMSVNQLMKLNGLGNADHVEAGQTLTVPGATGSHAGARGSGVSASGRVTVQDGDTLSEIADRHGMSVNQLMKLNGLGNADHVETGQTLLVYGPSKSTTSSSFRKGASEHVVRSGESLSVIAAGYGIGLSKLIAINAISDPDQVEAGTRLKLKGSPPVVKPATPKPATSKPASVPAASKPVAAKPVTPGPRPAAPKPKQVAATPTVATPAKAKPQPETKPTTSTPDPAISSTRPSATVTNTTVTNTTVPTTTVATTPAIAATSSTSQAPISSRTAPRTTTAATFEAAKPSASATSAAASRTAPSAAATSTMVSGETAKTSTSATAIAAPSRSQAAISSRFSPRATPSTSTPVADSDTSAISRPVSNPVARPASSSPVATAAPQPTAARTAAPSATAPRTSAPRTAATAVATRSGKPDWRTYGPLQIDWTGWQPMGGSMVAPTLNAQGQSLYLAINCGARKLNATTQAGDWKTWDDPSSDYERQLVNDYCRSRS